MDSMNGSTKALEKGAEIKGEALQLKGEAFGPPWDIYREEGKRREEEGRGRDGMEKWVPLMGAFWAVTLTWTSFITSPKPSSVKNTFTYTLYDWVFVVETKAALFYTW